MEECENKGVDMGLKKILEELLLEMSYKGKRAKEKIEGLNFHILSHIINILLIKYDKNQKVNYNHWLKELHTSLNNIDKITVNPKHKKLPYRIYFEILFVEYLDVPLDFFKGIVNQIIEEKNMNINIENINIQQFYNNLKNIYNELCFMLSQNFVYTKDKLEELLKKE